MFITIQDFQTGKFELHTGMYDVQRLQAYIDKYESKYLVNLLGAELFNQFEADVILGGGTPTEQRFIDIFEPFRKDISCDVVISEGMVEMLKGFIYFEYSKDLVNQVTPVGHVVPVGENSENPTTLYSMIYTRYNEGCKTYKSIQRFICDSMSDYSDFNGEVKSFAYWI